MLTSLEELRRILPPPAKPFHTTGDWRCVEAELGSPLPDDYKQFIAVYGQGKICNSLWIDNYLALGESESALTVISTYLTQYWDIQRIGVRIPYPLFPDANGLLPIGGLENGGAINWRMVGAPDEWDIVVWDSEIDEFYPAVGLTLVPFLIELVSMRWCCFSRRFDPASFAATAFVPWS